MKTAKPIDKSMIKRVNSHKVGWIFSPIDFIDLGSRSAIDKALSRMTATHLIRRIARGLYDAPQHHPVIGSLHPSIDNIAHALAGRDGARLQPTGAYAANLLGLSEQVPAKVVFLTDGRSKRVRLGNLDIVLKQTSTRNMTTAGTISGLVIQALRYLGKSHVDSNTEKRLASKLSTADKRQLVKDLRYAPAWIGVIIKRINTEFAHG